MGKATAGERGVDSMIDAGTDGFRPVPLDQPKAGASLAELARFFITKPSPAFIVATFDWWSGPASIR